MSVVRGRRRPVASRLGAAVGGGLVTAVSWNLSNRLTYGRRLAGSVSASRTSSSRVRREMRLKTVANSSAGSRPGGAGVEGARRGKRVREEALKLGGEGQRGPWHHERHAHGDGAAGEYDRRARGGVGVRYHERRNLLSEGCLKPRRIGTEGKGQGRSVVFASIFLSLRESPHGERGGLMSGPEGGRSKREERGDGGSSVVGNPRGLRRGCWAGDLVLGRGLGVGEDQGLRSGRFE